VHGNTELSRSDKVPPSWKKRKSKHQNGKERKPEHVLKVSCAFYGVQVPPLTRKQQTNNGSNGARSSTSSTYKRKLNKTF
jgi:hypothetical protein